jgi:hypothetical protein
LSWPRSRVQEALANLWAAKEIDLKGRGKRKDAPYVRAEVFKALLVLPHATAFRQAVKLTKASPNASSNLRGLRYELEKKEHGVRRPKKPGQNDHPSGMAVTIAKETGVSPPTVPRDAQSVKALESMDLELANSSK